LGATLVEAYRTWADRIDVSDEDIYTISQLIDRYELLVLPHKALKTQESNRASLGRIRKVFGHLKPEELTTPDVFRYRDKVADNHGKKTANLDKEVFSHLYSKAIEWGVVINHPIKGKVPKLFIPPRDRYVEDLEITEVLKVASPLIRSFIWIKLMTGGRRGDILGLSLDDIDNPNGIRFKPSKTSHSSARRIIIPWSEELAAWKSFTLKHRVASDSDLVFITSRGQPYLKPNGTANAFDTLWKRFMNEALEKTDLKERFQQLDLRPKTASDTDLQHASRLLVHTTEDITKKVYRRKGDTVNHVPMRHLFDDLEK